MNSLQIEVDLLNLLSNESDADWAAGEKEVLLFSLTAKKHKSPNNFYLSKRKTHGQFKMTFEIHDDVFTKYFRLNRNQFAEVHATIQHSIAAKGCNAQERIEKNLECF